MPADDNDEALDLAALEAVLRAERDRLTSRVERLQADADDEVWSQPRPDEADQGVAAVERERLRSLAGQTRERRREVSAALARIAEGTYGKCTMCGDQIPAPRLEARPESALCMTCQQRRR